MSCRSFGRMLTRPAFGDPPCASSGSARFRVTHNSYSVRNSRTARLNPSGRARLGMWPALASLRAERDWGCGRRLRAPHNASRQRFVQLAHGRWVHSILLPYQKEHRRRHGCDCIGIVVVGERGGTANESIHRGAADHIADKVKIRRVGLYHISGCGRITKRSPSAT